MTAKLGKEAEGKQLNNLDASTDIINKVIDIFGLTVKAILGLVIVAILAFIGLSVFMVVAPLLGMEQSIAIETLAFVNTTYQPLLLQVWGILKPVVQLIIIIAVIRWFIFPRRQSYDRLRGLVTDLPSVIALIVISTICLITLLEIEIPDALANISLVIVGFYFGQEKLKREPTAQEIPLDSPPTTESNQPLDQQGSG